METLAPSFSITRIDAKGEIHFTASGFWTMETMVEFQREMIAKAKPLFTKGIPMRSLADLRGFVAQNKTVATAIRTAITEAVKLGTERTAIIYDSMLVKMQYERLHDGIELRTFEDKQEALTWLRQ
ncbi:MAG: STAS/SEC14 domain-containing protein [Pseudomonadota bacterium]